MRADSDGNLYVARYGQGRVLVFSEKGIPIGQILLPGRDDGHNLQSTSMAIKPGTNDIYIVTSDRNGGQRLEHFARQSVREGSATLLAPVN